MQHVYPLIVGGLQIMPFSLKRELLSDGHIARLATCGEIMNGEVPKRCTVVIVHRSTARAVGSGDDWIDVDFGSDS